MSTSVKLTLLAGIEPTRRALRAHAMKNCTGVILDLCALLERDLPIPRSERWARLRDDVSRLRRLLVDELLDEAAALQRTRPCCVKSLVSSVVARFADRAENAGVRLAVDCGGGVVFADEHGLTEALFNLIANALDATPSGGSVSLSTFEAHDGDQYWELRDTGRGMEAEQLASLARGIDARRPGPPGLGMAIARVALAEQGGLLSVESAIGAGTTVVVWLPRRAPRPPDDALLPAE
jgi:signal transduction histidine kinase